MKHAIKLAPVLLLLGCAASTTSYSTTENSAPPEANVEAADWSMHATLIEACSCPMFCQCYFNTNPAQHVGCCPPGADPSESPRYCRFSNVFHVDEGSYGGVSLKGCEFWVAGDLGGDFSDGQMGWARLHFDPSVEEAQREGIVAALTALYPVKWESFEVGDDYPVEWTAGKDKSVAKLDGGKKGQVVLKRNQGMTDEPIVIQNLPYWGAPKNDGFVLMQNEVVAYSATGEPFEYKGTNGFMITVHIDSKGGTGKGY
jgi:hypothetical protein